MHGDAAFSGQGLNQEMLAFTRVPHFNVGGSVHLVVNNQLGFTTPSDRGRSSRYSSDLAKMIDAPVIHVNGDCPEAVRIALILVLYFLFVALGYESYGNGHQLSNSDERRHFY